MELVTAEQIAEEFLGDKKKAKKVLQDATNDQFPKDFPKISARPKVWSREEVEQYYHSR